MLKENESDEEDCHDDNVVEVNFKDLEKQTFKQEQSVKDIAIEKDKQEEENEEEKKK